MDSQPIDIIKHHRLEMNYHKVMRWMRMISSDFPGRKWGGGGPAEGVDSAFNKQSRIFLRFIPFLISY